MTRSFDPWDDEDVLCSRCKVATASDEYDTDEAHYRCLLQRAATALRAMPNRPKELEDFFYEVHGEAM